MKKFFVKAIATVLGIGYFPVAPGTAATVVGAALAFWLSNQPVDYAVVLLVLLVVGVKAADVVEKQGKEKDPGIVVIDEVVGIMVALWGLPLMWSVLVSGFFLFRAFDMFKIYPINRLEVLPGGWGIMLDDVMAGVYTNFILHIALRWAGL